MIETTSLKLKKGDTGSFAQIYDRFFEKIYRFIFFKIIDKSRAEDLSSEVFLRFVDYVKKNDVENVNAILYRISRNLIIDESKKLKEDYLGDDYLDSISDDNTISKIDAKLITEQILMDVLGELKDEYRDVIVMYYINEMTTKEIAEVFDKTEGNIRVLINRAINRMKEIVKNRQ